MGNYIVPKFQILQHESEEVNYPKGNKNSSKLNLPNMLDASQGNVFDNYMKQSF